MTVLIQSRPSNGAAALAAAINAAGVNCLRRRHDAINRLRASSFLVNWGCGNSYVDPHLNSTNSVSIAVDKARTFNALFSRMDARVSVPQFASNDTLPLYKEGEINDTDNIWLARHSLTGSGGQDITVVRPGDVWPAAPLYVKYIPKLVEFRVHVFRILNDVELLVRQKLRESDAEQTRDQRLIRNRDNGWVFGLVRDEGGANLAAREAIKAIGALGLDFGAVDVIIGRDDGKAYVLEVNTAPGLEAPATVEFYRDNIISRYNLWRDNGTG